MKLFDDVKDFVSRLFKKKNPSFVAENHGTHLITEKSSTRILEAYRMARTNLFYTGGDGDGVVFGVTSASPSDGKSLNCANLAISFAMSGKRVLLIDCDMRKPTQKTAFELKPESGLSEYLAGVSEAPAVMETTYENLFLLCSGRCPPNPAELLYRPRFAELIKEAKTEFDFVFVDLPPVGMISDATIVAPHIDSYVLVVRMGESDQRVTQAMVEQIEKVNGKIAGFLLNDVAENSSGSYGKYGRYGRYYRKYYGGYEHSSETSAEAAPEGTASEAAPEVTPEAAPEAAPEATPEVAPEVAPEAAPEEKKPVKRGTRKKKETK